MRRDEILAHNSGGPETRLYWLALVVLLDATDSSGNTQGSGVEIVVGGDYKPGRVTTTVTDLVVPAPGLPIQIQRTYDSLTRSRSGDFGFGWQLGINLQVEMAPTSDVTLTINGQRRTFYFTPPFNVLSITTPAYTPEPGLFGTLTAPGSNCPSNLVVKTGIVWICAIGYAAYAPSTLVYTDPYGRVYTMGGDGSLQSIQDVAGNKLTVTPTGITGSNGLNVPFVRDGQGRITQITDTLGNNYTYSYDANGNLQSATYPNTPPEATMSARNLEGTSLLRWGEREGRPSMRTTKQGVHEYLKHRRVIDAPPPPEGFILISPFQISAGGGF